MNKIIRTFLTSMIFMSCFGPEAVLASNSGDALNDLVQLGIVSPGQANSIGSRMGRGFFGGRFYGGAIPSVYDAGMVQRAARDIDKLQRDNVISTGELNALKAQLDARVNNVNSGGAAGGWSDQGRFHRRGYWR